VKNLDHYAQAIDPLHDLCPVRAALDVIRGRWKPSILFVLSGGPTRFGDLQSRLAGVTGQALTVQLRQLEADGVVVRTVYAEVPPRVEYSLSDSGRSLFELMDGLETWGQEYLRRKPRR
jgi:DNA-binding HxlR family transcriptional regulator